MRAEHQHNLGYLLARASQRWNDLLAQELAASGFPEVRPSYGALLIPLFVEDYLRIGELGQRARLSKQAMTTMVRLMESAGLIATRTDPGDRRASRVVLTQRTRELEGTLPEVLDRVERRFTVGADPGSLNAFRDTLLLLLEGPGEQSRH